MLLLFLQEEEEMDGTFFLCVFQNTREDTVIEDTKAFCDQAEEIGTPFLPLSPPLARIINF